jgi:hypothetical protein
MADPMRIARAERKGLRDFIGVESAHNWRAYAKEITLSHTRQQVWSINLNLVYR